MPVNLQNSTIRWHLMPRWVFEIGTLLYVLSRFVPCAPPKHFSILDDSWMQVLHVAFYEHWQFGRDIVFTFGPWGFLYGGYDPATHLISVVVWTVLAVIFWQATWQACRLCFNDRAVGWVWVMAFIAVSGLAGFTLYLNLDIRLSVWVLLLLILHFFARDKRCTAMQVLLVISLGLVSLIKLNMFVSAWVAVVIVAIDNVWRQKRFPWILPVFMASILFFWLMAGQHLSSFIPFVCNSLPIISGYNDAMSFTGTSDTWGMILFLVLATCLCALIGLLTWRRHRHFGMLSLAGISFFGFIAFKYGFIRNDDHVIVAWILLGEMAIAVTAMAWKMAEKKERWILVSIFLLTLISLSLAASNFIGSSKAGVSRALAQILSFNAEPQQAFFSGETLLESHKKYLADIRRKFPVPSAKEKADIYCWNQMAVLAQGLNYHPRPVFQSYSAYTPELAELNAAFLRSRLAPDNILFEIEPIDNHYPTLDDGRSWPELLTRYDIQNTNGPFLLLTRAAVPREYQKVLLVETNLTFGRALALPPLDEGPVWAEIEFNKSMFGFAVSTLYKPPVLLIKVALRDGQNKSFRLIPGMASGGFLVSPIIEDQRSFVLLAAHDWSNHLINQEVTSLTISAATESGDTACYKSPLHLRFYRLDCSQPNLGQMARQPSSR